MNRQKTILGLLLIGATLFNFLFWRESLGINVLLFSIFIIVGLVFINAKKALSIPAKITSVCTLLLAGLIILNHSILSIVMFMISFFAMIGFVHQAELKLFFYGFFQSFSNLKLVTDFLGGTKDELDFPEVKVDRSLAFAQITLFPLFILGVFYSLYYSANPVFASYSDSTWNWIVDVFTWDVSFEKILFWWVGFFICGIVLWKAEASKWVDKNNAFTEYLLRKKIIKPGSIQKLSMLGLKTELRTALMMLGMLNVLLFMVNLIDINFVWFNFEENPNYSLKTYVHQGTYTLIASILLAMAIIIYYFRGNLNFYKENINLQNLTYVWILQNAILAFSVGIRNYRYIEYHGLAYKRIGVIIFLIAVMIGLVTMFIKVKEKRSLYFLINRNAWAVYLLLMISSFVSWDIVITKYNILVDSKRALEIEVLANNLSDKNWYLLKTYKEEILAKSPQTFTEAQFDKICENKRLQIEDRIGTTSWLSWNYPDCKNLEMMELE